MTNTCSEPVVHEGSYIKPRDGDQEVTALSELCVPVPGSAVQAGPAWELILGNAAPISASLLIRLGQHTGARQQCSGKALCAESQEAIRWVPESGMP